MSISGPGGERTGRAEDRCLRLRDGPAGKVVAFPVGGRGRSQSSFFVYHSRHGLLDQRLLSMSFINDSIEVFRPAA